MRLQYFPCDNLARENAKGSRWVGFQGRVSTNRAKYRCYPGLVGIIRYLQNLLYIPCLSGSGKYYESIRIDEPETYVSIDEPFFTCYQDDNHEFTTTRINNQISGESGSDTGISGKQNG